YDEDIDPVEHYIEFGADLGYATSTSFDTRWYLFKNPEVKDKNINPLIDYIFDGSRKGKEAIAPFNRPAKLNAEDYQDYRIIEESGLFDADWYRDTYGVTSNPIEHYLRRGFKENKQVSTSQYLEESNVNPLIKQLTSEHLLTRKPLKIVNTSYDKEEDYDIRDSQLYNIIHEYELLDKDYYLTKYDLDKSVDPLKHFLEIGYHNGYQLNEDYVYEKYLNPEYPTCDVLFNYVYEYAMSLYQGELYNVETSLSLDDSIEYHILYDDKLFDADYYYSKNLDVKNAGVDAIEHYLKNGFREGRNPSKDFNTNFYYKLHPEHDESLNPLVEYIYNNYEDDLTGLTPEPVSLEDTQDYTIISESELFDENWYAQEYAVDSDVVADFLVNANMLLRNPSRKFNTQDYLESHDEVTCNALVDYIYNNLFNLDVCDFDVVDEVVDEEYMYNYELLSNSIYFDEDYYKKVNPNIPVGCDAIDYYLRKGCRESYPTSKYFDAQRYLDYNPDLEVVGVDALLHFIKSGFNEKRRYKRVKLSEYELSEYSEEVRECYDDIYESDLFDEGYYLSMNPHILANDEDPYIHYILYGVKQGLDPSSLFSTSRYLQVYGDVRRIGLNPLHHYIIHGESEKRNILLPYDDFNENWDEKYGILASKSIYDRLCESTTVIVNVSGSYESLIGCVSSILSNTTLNYELVLINNTLDERVAGFLDTLSTLSYVKVFDAVELGYVTTLNQVISATSGDVVLMGGDTIVPTRWLSHLIVNAYKESDVATVSPLYDAGDLSLNNPSRQEQINSINYTLDKHSSREDKTAPTSHPNFAYIKNGVFKSIGCFSTESNNNDILTEYSYKAYQKGYKNIRDANIFVYNKNIITESEKELDKKVINKYPNIKDDLDDFYTIKSFDKHSESIKTRLDDNKSYERILCITEYDEDDVPIIDNHIKKLSQKYDTYVMAVGTDKIGLYKYTKQTLVLMGNNRFDYTWDYDKFYKLYFNLLVNIKIDLIYVKYYTRLYHPTNADKTLIINLAQYLEVELVHEATIRNQDILDTADKLLNPTGEIDELIKAKSHIDFKEEKLVVYTAVTGTYDEPITPSYVNPEFDYICFTNNPNLKSDFWDIRLMEEDTQDNVRMARKYKILPHKYLSEYDYSLWVDTNFEITGDLSRYIDKYSINNKLMCIKHDMRDCIYDEAHSCIDSQKDNPDIIEQQISKYSEEGYPAHNGLIASGIIFRDHHDEDVKMVMQTWYEEVSNHSKRDQLSFNYACWKNNFKYDESRVFYFKNEYFQRHDHLRNGFIPRIASIDFDCDYDLKYDDDATQKILESFDKKVSVVIPIYNAYDETKSCIESVLEYTNSDYELILINDCSSDERIKTLLDSYRDYDNIQVIHNQTNQGFVKNVNKAFAITSNDVVLLNSDTLVTPKWLEKLRITAYTQDNIATVTPVSNNAGAFSVPCSGVNILDDNLSINDMNNIVEKSSDTSFIFTPTANGFCMYIKRDAIYSVGFFDESYGLGYCEENDFCMRLNYKGYFHVIDPSVYIYHKHSASFSSQKEELMAKNRRILDEKFPLYKQSVNEFLQSHNFESLRRKLQRILSQDNVQDYNTKRILYVIHEGYGGTLHTSIELMKNVDENMDAYLLVTGDSKISLYKYDNTNSHGSEYDGDYEFKNNLDLLRVWNIHYDYNLLDFTLDEIRKIYFNILVYLKFDIIHVRHLIFSTFDIAYLAKTLEIPLVLSFHDFYYVCPSHNLLDDKRNYCGGICTPIDKNNMAQCNLVGGDKLPPARTIIAKWREEVRKLFDCCSCFVTTSKSAKDIYTNIYPELGSRDFRVIEHGRDLQTPDTTEYVEEISTEEPIKILFPGHIGYTKGYNLIKAIKELDVDNKLEFHYMGNITGHMDLEDYGVNHGFYNRSEFTEIVHQIKPHFIGILSIWPETYCHTLTEGWASGIPVLTIDIGALGERVKSNGGGFFIENDPKQAYERILEIASDNDEYMKVASQIPDITFKSTRQMADDYIKLYDKYMKH
ncbi:MAG: hypothetical protein BZ136_01345, partial [Methanosphaera sp. rholeuAM74]